MKPKRLKLPCLLVLVLLGFASSDLSKDREKCANQLVGIVTCLPYVGGEAKTPTAECCTGLKQVVDKSMECLCLLGKYRDDPSLGLKINVTLALGLPDKCHTPVNVSECPALLHLAPNSPDAKVFDDFAKRAKGSNNSTSTAQVRGTSSGQTQQSADVKSEGVRRRNWWGNQMSTGLIITVALYYLCLTFK